MYDTLRPELITATDRQRRAMAVNPTAVVMKDMFLQNAFPYLEVRRPFILGTQAQQWQATLSHRFVEVLHAPSPSPSPSPILTSYPYPYPYPYP